jgi:hypothetical protein
MKEQERDRVLPRRFLVNEMKILAVDPGSKVWKRVQIFLAGSPVKILCPVKRKLPHLRDRERVVISNLPRPSRPPQSLPQIIKDTRHDVDLKRLNHYESVIL